MPALLSEETVLSRPGAKNCKLSVLKKYVDSSQTICISIVWCQLAVWLKNKRGY